MEKVVALLKKFDFTEAESKTYVTLLKTGACTGYEASKQSGVPRSKIYNILESLQVKGCVIVSRQTNPVKYSAIAIDEFIENVQLGVQDALDEVRQELQDFSCQVDMDCFWHLYGYRNIFNRCRHMLAAAKNEVFIQVWKDDVGEVLKDLRRIEDILPKVVIILYSLDNDYDVGLKRPFRHGFEKAKLAESGGRWINLVIDSREMIFGHIQNEKNAEVIWTESEAMVFLARENILHDAYCLKLLDTFGKDAKQKFGNEFEGVRSIFG